MPSEKWPNQRSRHCFGDLPGTQSEMSRQFVVPKHNPATLSTKFSRAIHRFFGVPPTPRGAGDRLEPFELRLFDWKHW
jgi:hypothetical protein